MMDIEIDCEVFKILLLGSHRVHCTNITRYNCQNVVRCHLIVINVDGNSVTTVEYTVHLTQTPLFSRNGCFAKLNASSEQ